MLNASKSPPPPVPAGQTAPEAEDEPKDGTNSVPGWLSVTIGKLEGRYAPVLPGKPDDEEGAPTLDGSPDALDNDKAIRLHTRASRWIEYVASEVAKAEAKRILREGARDRYKERLKFKRKKIENATEEEFEQLDQLEAMYLEAKAEEVLLNGWYKSLVKVKDNASRQITKNNGGGGGFSPQQ